MGLQVQDFPASENNYTPGRDVIVDQVVIHTMVGSRTSARATFQSDSLDKPRSAHYGIAYEGGAIDRYVPETSTAWHAGNWQVNQRSIGIEDEDRGAYDEPRPSALYVSVGQLVADIARRHPRIPLVEEDDPERPGILPHRVAVATHCPGTLDVPLIIGLARGATGVFDPRHNAEDLAWFDQRVRDLVTGEDIAAFALYVALGRYTGNLPKTVKREIERTRRRVEATRTSARRAPRERGKRKSPVTTVRAGHGKE
jgi:hypothetical protein